MADFRSRTIHPACACQCNPLHEYAGSSLIVINTLRLLTEAGGLCICAIHLSHYSKRRTSPSRRSTCIPGMRFCGARENCFDNLCRRNARRRRSCMRGPSIRGRADPVHQDVRPCLGARLHRWRWRIWRQQIEVNAVAVGGLRRYRDSRRIFGIHWWRDGIRSVCCRVR